MSGMVCQASKIRPVDILYVDLGIPIAITHEEKALPFGRECRVRLETGTFCQRRDLPVGSNSDVAVPGDYDGDEKFDPAVFRGPGGTWFVSRSSEELLIQQFGQNGDSPVPNSFVW